MSINSFWVYTENISSIQYTENTCENTVNTNVNTVNTINTYVYTQGDSQLF